MEGRILLHSVVCPQCGHSSLEHYGHYSRKEAFINDEDARRTLIIKKKRINASGSYFFREPIKAQQRTIPESCCP